MAAHHCSLVAPVGRQLCESPHPTPSSCPYKRASQLFQGKVSSERKLRDEYHRGASRRHQAEARDRGQRCGTRPAPTACPSGLPLTASSPRGVSALEQPSPLCGSRPAALLCVQPHPHARLSGRMVSAVAGLPPRTWGAYNTLSMPTEPPDNASKQPQNADVLTQPSVLRSPASWSSRTTSQQPCP